MNEEVSDFDLFIEEKNNRIKELEKENEELKDKVSLAGNRVAELKMQIEKMKCCENCKFWEDNDCIVEHDYDCKRWNDTNTDDFWEMKK